MYGLILFTVKLWPWTLFADIYFRGCCTIPIIISKLWGKLCFINIPHLLLLLPLSLVLFHAATFFSVNWQDSESVVAASMFHYNSHDLAAIDTFGQPPLIVRSSSAWLKLISNCLVLLLLSTDCCHSIHDIRHQGHQ